jgi:hypothetical protein
MKAPASSRRSAAAHRATALAASGCAALLAVGAFGAAADGPPYSPYSPPVAVDHPMNVYWGDTHVHSSWSPDAGSSGNLRLSPEYAFRFARGDEITAHNGEKVRLRRPLDFLLVSDHSEYLGLYPMLEEGDPDLLATATGQRWAEMLRNGERKKIGGEFAASLGTNEDLVGSSAFAASMWQRVVENAERFNDPGRFTAFIGYEWTSMPGGANLHRNILFRDGAEATLQIVPMSSIDSTHPEDLWQYLADYERKTGGSVFAIPHNSNMSAGRMFERVDSDGQPFTRAYAEARTRWEPIVEATQIKGDSEVAPFLSPDDEFADFGTWDFLAGMSPGAHEDGMYDGEYVRSALGNGLAEARRIGANPFEFGLIGSTDSHTSLATADDSNFWGKFSRNEPHADRASEPWADLEMPEGSPAAARLATTRLPDGMFTWALVASGYAGVWASDNTREALFDAMRRKETYATTGPRMVVRFFGGWEFDADDALAPDLAGVGYAGGVPMGSHLTPKAEDATPTFLVSALRDPEGANIDRIQIVKLSLGGADGAQVRERIHDVSVSGDRKIGAEGRCREEVGNTVDVAAASYSNAIGASSLAAVWRDPDFDPTSRALYYVRVLEIPTPRWTTYDSAHYGTPLPERAPATLQQRAYTSPIWYTPPSS